jgi:NAD(P)-dependent dehydrogenase (short-subunit alcohol dehydrogenase family)
MAAKKAQSKSTAKSKMPAPLRLRDKVAVVTGGGRGIGQAIARVLAGEGCTVVITGRDKASLTRSATRISKKVHGRGKVVPLICDVRDSEGVAAVFAKVKQRFRGLDILVNNAGVSQAPTAIENTSLELWRDLVDTNLTGMFLCTRAALPLMRSGATIINNLSAAAKQVFPQFAAYTAAKTGAYGFTLSLREELMARGIRVTALMPGATATDIWNQIMPDASRDKMMDVESIAQAVLYAVLLPPEANLSELLLTPTAGGV